MYVYTHTMEYYSAIKKNAMMPPATAWMDGSRAYHTKGSESDKDKYCHMPSLRCGV